MISVTAETQTTIAVLDAEVCEPEVSLNSGGDLVKRLKIKKIKTEEDYADFMQKDLLEGLV